MLKELVEKNRSYRRFLPGHPLKRETLLELVDTARHVASAWNKQPVRYAVTCDPEKNEIIRSSLEWPDFFGFTPPAPEEAPTGYIIVLGDTTIHTSIGLDAGIAAQTILLAAVERGLGGCIFALMKREVIAPAFAIPERYKILVVIGLGTPADRVMIEDREPEQATAFFRDEDGVPHVHKRRLEDVLIGA